MNDILFILVMFFLIVATLANPNVIKVMLPKAQSNTKAKQTVVVTIDKDNIFYVGTNAVPLAGLKEALLPKLAQDAEGGTIVVNADRSVAIEHLVEVMQIAHELGAKVVLATAHPTQR
ncbi:biopolymer transporter ExbD [Compostibacter hankyongensis]|uniref:Biopolymer transporter ExbD n=1 Tax=Compostibacter hankyongensis TaxID=1007089 RepID=A0ABP8G795_9BACT